MYKAGKAGRDATALSAAGAASGSTAPASGAAGEGPPVSVTTVRAEKRDQAVMLEANGSVTPLTRR